MHEEDDKFIDFDFDDFDERAMMNGAYGGRILSPSEINLLKAEAEERAQRKAAEQAVERPETVAPEPDAPEASTPEADANSDEQKPAQAIVTTERELLAPNTSFGAEGLDAAANMDAMVAVAEKSRSRWVYIGAVAAAIVIALIVGVYTAMTAPRYCAVDGCGQEVGELADGTQAAYCSEHLCAAENCPNAHTQASVYCAAHNHSEEFVGVWTATSTVIASEEDLPQNAGEGAVLEFGENMDVTLKFGSDASTVLSGTYSPVDEKDDGGAEDETARFTMSFETDEKTYEFVASLMDDGEKSNLYLIEEAGGASALVFEHNE